METKPGYIRIGIDKKVYFEPDGLPKPKHNPSEYSDLGILTFKLRKAWEEYEASKKLIEVENVYWWDESKVWTYTSRYYKEFDAKEVINNQPCKAEIENNKATIIELIK